MKRINLFKTIISRNFNSNIKTINSTAINNTSNGLLITFKNSLMRQFLYYVIKWKLNGFMYSLITPSYVNYINTKYKVKFYKIY